MGEPHGHWLKVLDGKPSIERNRGVPEIVLTRWARPVRQFAFKLKHWSGALSWSRMEATGGDVSELATYAFQTINRLRPDWEDSFIRRKILGIARRSGVNPALIHFE